MFRRAQHIGAIGTLSATCLLCCACAAPTQRVTLVFEDDAGAPVAGAHVRAISLGRNDVPLPVNMETLGEAFATGKLVAQGWTDWDGRVELRLLRARTHSLEASPPALSFGSGVGIQRWLLSPESGVISPISVGAEPSEKAAKPVEKPPKLPAADERDLTVRVVRGG